MMDPFFKIQADGNFSIDVAGMKSKKWSLFIATPLYNSADPLTDNAIAKTLRIFGECGFNCRHRTHRNNSLVPLARCILNSEFMASGMSHCLWWDGDVIAKPDEPVRMMAANMDILGGVYARRFIFWDEIVKAAKDGRFDDLSTAGQRLTTSPKPFADVLPWAVEVDTLPGGFLMVKREVILAMMAKYPERKSVLEGKNPGAEDEFFYEFWPCGGSPYRGEDTWFCELARGAGYKLYADTVAMLGHCGNHVFSSDPRKLIPQKGET